MLISVDLTSIGFDKNTNPVFTQDLSHYHNKVAFHFNVWGMVTNFLSKTQIMVIGRK